MARKRDKAEDADRADEAIDAAEVARVLSEAASMLPPEADLSHLHELLGAGEVSLAWEELRTRAEPYPMNFWFWVHMSKAADLLGVP